MNVPKIILLVIFLSLSPKGMAAWALNFDPKEDIADWEENVSHAMTENNQKFVVDESISLSEIKDMQTRVLSLIVEHPGRSRLHLIMAQLYAAETHRLIQELKERGLDRQEVLENDEYASAFQSIDSYYAKALDLDDGSLSIQELLPMTYISSADIRVAATRKMMARFNGGEKYNYVGTEHGIPEDFHFDNYSYIVSAYVDEKRFEEALAVLDEMAEKFPYAGQEIKDGIERVQALSEKAVSHQEDQRGHGDKPSQPQRHAANVATQAEKKGDSSEVEAQEDRGFGILFFVLIFLASIAIFIFSLRRRSVKHQ